MDYQSKSNSNSYISNYENNVAKEEIACEKQFLFLPQYF